MDYEDLKKYYMERFERAGFSRTIAEKYAEGIVKWMINTRGEKWVSLEVIKVNESLKYMRYILPTPLKDTDEEMLETVRKSVNVGDFIVLPSGKIYRRVRGGFREANLDEVILLIASQL